MERSWATSAFPCETTVLNLRLRPYSCGHEVLLCRIGSPLVLGGESAWNDLFVATLICSMSFAEGLAAIQKPAKVRLHAVAWKIALKLNRRLLLPSELSKFREYLAAGSWSPPTYELTTGYQTRTLKAPRVYRLIPMLCAKLGLTEREALDFPMARANAYQAADMDLAGNIDLEGGREETSLIKHLADLEARAAKGEDVWGS